MKKKTHYKIKELLKNNSFVTPIKSLSLILDQDINWVLKNDDYLIEPLDYVKFLEIEKCLAVKTDYTFLLGYKYFFDNKILLEKGVFVPQYDSEEMIHTILELYQKEINNENINVLEIGFGTGAISIALAKKTMWKFDAIDINEKAVALAKKNSFIHQTKNQIFFSNDDLFQKNFLKKYNIIVSNPPYIKLGDKNVSEWVKENQPKEALYSEENGIKHIKKLLEVADNVLLKNGILVFEFGFEQKNLIQELINLKKWYYKFYKDLNNNWRYILLRKKDESK